MLIFEARRPPFPKKIVRCAPKTVFPVFSENTFFFRKNCWIKKGYIHFWCKMISYRSHNDPAAVSQRK